MNTPQHRVWLKRDAAARRLGVPHATVDQMIAAGQITAKPIHATGTPVLVRVLASSLTDHGATREAVAS